MGCRTDEAPFWGGGTSSTPQKNGWSPFDVPLDEPSVFLVLGSGGFGFKESGWFSVGNVAVNSFGSVSKYFGIICGFLPPIPSLPKSQQHLLITWGFGSTNQF